MRYGRKDRLCCTVEAEAIMEECSDKGPKRGPSRRGCKCEKPMRATRVKGEGAMCVGCEEGRLNKRDGTCVIHMKHGCPKGYKPTVTEDGDDCAKREKE